MNGMRWLFPVLILMSVFSGVADAAIAKFDSGSTGADGEFDPTANVTLELPADGIFNFTTVTIPSGVTVTFKKNADNTPVYILASGDVTIDGTIGVSGGNAVGVYPGQGAPSAFDGGYGGVVGRPGGNGLGPGGGDGGCYRCISISYGRNGSTGGKQGIFNLLGEKLVTLIGGSGGGGGGGNVGATGGGGGGGGGAILIASSGTLSVNGAVYANGGSGAGGGYNSYYNGTGGGGGGSGGAIKLMAETIAGNGTIQAVGGGKGCSYNCGQDGGAGKIRLEANTLQRTSGSSPGYSFGYPGSVFIDALPTLNIVSIGGVNTPADTVGSFKQADIVLPRNILNPVEVVLSASQIPPDSTVTLSAVPEWGAKSEVSGVLAGTVESSSATVSLEISREFTSVIMATVTFDLTLASNKPMFIEGEKVAKVRVSTVLGGGSSVVYITESGKEIDAKYM